MGRKSADEHLNLLFEGILTLRTIEDCENFFGDLCTKTELREMSKRLYAATLIAKGEKYADIVEKTGLSTATITRVNGCLRDGNDGYVYVLKHLGEKET
ncbi:MAG: TrpR-like protein, YerC/YecD [Ruminococcaceae bacterium]|nr:TrpR-like protein, YerC/YecD [Oscillospiraceae bacterium]